VSKNILELTRKFNYRKNETLALQTDEEEQAIPSTTDHAFNWTLQSPQTTMVKMAYIEIINYFRLYIITLTSDSKHTQTYF